MHDLRKLVSSANLLYTLEAVARHESFTLVDVYIVARKGRDLHPAACELRDRLIQEGMTLTD